MTEPSRWPCPAPVFPYNAERGWYEACTNCGRLAWSHEQADPLADIRSEHERMRTGEPVVPEPPVMRP